MPVQFIVRERFDPREHNAPRKYYPTARSTGAINLPRIAARISTMSALNRADVQAAIDLLVQVVCEEVAEGNRINLGDFGSFMLTVSGTGSTNKEEVNASNITTARLRFHPGPELNKVLNMLRYEKIS